MSNGPIAHPPVQKGSFAPFSRSRMVGAENTFFSEKTRHPVGGPQPSRHQVKAHLCPVRIKNPRYKIKNHTIRFGESPYICIIKRIYPNKPITYP